MALTPTLKKALRFELKRFALVAQKYEARWSYTQYRPFSGLGVPPSDWHHNDCSSYVSLAYYFGQRMIQKGVADPLGEHYSGYGNTETAHAYLMAHHAPKDKYLVGDVGLYLEGPQQHHHAIFCITAGTAATSLWTSHGREAGPEPVKLGYRKDLTGVYRHPALL